MSTLSSDQGSCAPSNLLYKVAVLSRKQRMQSKAVGLHFIYMHVFVLVQITRLVSTDCTLSLTLYALSTFCHTYHYGDIVECDVTDIYHLPLSSCTVSVCTYTPCVFKNMNIIAHQWHSNYIRTSVICAYVMST